MDTFKNLFGYALIAALIPVLTWAFFQISENHRRQSELAEQFSQLQAQPGTKTNSNSVDSNIDFRLGAMEESILKLETAFTEFAENQLLSGERLANMQNASYQTTDIDDDDAVGFGYFESVRYDSPSVDIPGLSFTDRVYNRYSSEIAVDGNAPERAELVSAGLAQVAMSNDGSELNVLFEPPMCSNDRCLVRADISQTRFSLNNLENDPDFVAHDSYHNFLASLDKSINASMPQPSQVSVSRSGDQIVVNITPKKQSIRSAKFVQ